MKLHFRAAHREVAQRAYHMFTQRYGQIDDPANADVIVSLGGDSEAIHALKHGILHRKPVFGLNFGHVGFLENLNKEDENLIVRIKAAESVILSPLRAKVEFIDGSTREDFAINEISVRQMIGGESTHLRFTLDNVERVPFLSGDGIIISTTVGSTAYSNSAGGSVACLGDDIILFTPNNPYKPKFSPNIIRPRPMTIDVIEPEYRPAEVWADSTLIGEKEQKVRKVDIELDTSHPYELLFDPGYSLHEKVMRTQFPTSVLG